ncbi:MAG TPA: malonate transporter subunit MadM [Longimicrobiales bacterium]|nr:malonate transporter subunit MadM [Longimicrobiales bacterium]
MSILQTLGGVLAANGLVTAFAFVGLLTWLSYLASNRLTRGHVHGSAIAILAGLVLAWVGGVFTGGSKGLADIPVLAGVGILGGAMLRDLAIVATAFGVDLRVIRRAGPGAAVSLLVGVFGSFVVGAAVAYAFGYTDTESMVTIGAGAATYIVGPVTGTAIGASSDVIALSIAAGLVKSMLVMTGTPFVAKAIKLDNPHTAMVFGGLMGTTSGVAGGLAATDPKLVPYGAMTATFYTGLGCLLGPSVFYFAVRAVFG